MPTTMPTSTPTTTPTLMPTSTPTPTPTPSPTTTTTAINQCRLTLLCVRRSQRAGQNTHLHCTGPQPPGLRGSLQAQRPRVDVHKRKGTWTPLPSSAAASPSVSRFPLPRLCRTPAWPTGRVLLSWLISATLRETRMAGCRQSGISNLNTESARAQSLHTPSSSGSRPGTPLQLGSYNSMNDHDAPKRGKKPAAPAKPALDGCKIALSGTFPGATHAAIKARVEALGATIASTVTDDGRRPRGTEDSTHGCRLRPPSSVALLVFALFEPAIARLPTHWSQNGFSSPTMSHLSHRMTRSKMASSDRAGGMMSNL
jgi:hypothetical protein